MKIRKRAIALLLIVVMLLYIVPTSKVQAYVNVSNTVVTHPSNATSGYFHVSADCHWLAVLKQTYIQFTGPSFYYYEGNGSGTVSYTMSPNTSTSPKITEIRVTNLDNGNEYVDVNVVQQGCALPSIVLNPSVAGTYNYQPHSLTQYFTSSLGWTISSNASFLTCSPTSGSGSTSQQSVSINLANNNSRNSRTGTVTITSGNVSKQIVITQTGAPELYDQDGHFTLFYPNTSSTRTAYLSFTASVSWNITCTSGVTPSRTSGGPGTYTVSFAVPYNGGSSQQVQLHAGSVTNYFNVNKNLSN